MRASMLSLALMLAMGGWAHAQTEPQAVPTDECTPGSMQVILGLCTARQREQAKTLNTESAASSSTVAHMVKPSAPHGGATISVRLSADEITAIDAWIARQSAPAGLNRAEAVHQILRSSLPPVSPIE